MMNFVIKFDKIYLVSEIKFLEFKALNEIGRDLRMSGWDLISIEEKELRSYCHFFGNVETILNSNRNDAIKIICDNNEAEMREMKRYLAEEVSPIGFDFQMLDDNLNAFCVLLRNSIKSMVEGQEGIVKFTPRTWLKGVSIFLIVPSPSEKEVLKIITAKFMNELKNKPPNIEKQLPGDKKRIYVSKKDNTSLIEVRLNFSPKEDYSLTLYEGLDGLDRYYRYYSGINKSLKKMLKYVWIYRYNDAINYLSNEIKGAKLQNDQYRQNNLNTLYNNLMKYITYNELKDEYFALLRRGQEKRDLKKQKDELRNELKRYGFFQMCELNLRTIRDFEFKISELSREIENLNVES